MNKTFLVIPAKAGIQWHKAPFIKAASPHWTPFYNGVTIVEKEKSPRVIPGAFSVS